MKTKLSNKTWIANSLIALFVLITSYNLIAQDKKPNDLKDFKVVIEKTNNGIKTQSLQGSAWVDLAFSINKYKPQAIDEYGMTELENVSSEKDTNLVNFLFTIIKTEKGIVLKGIEGTAWTDLSFYLKENERQMIDQYGITKLN